MLAWQHPLPAVPVVLPLLTRPADSNHGTYGPRNVHQGSPDLGVAQLHAPELLLCRAAILSTSLYQYRSRLTQPASLIGQPMAMALALPGIFITAALIAGVLSFTCLNFSSAGEGIISCKLFS